MVKTALQSALRGLMRTPVWGLKRGFRPILRRLRLFFTNPVCHHIDLLRDRLQSSMDNLSHIPREADRLILGFLKMQETQQRQATIPWQAVPLGPNRLLVRHPLAGFMYVDPADVFTVPRILIGNHQVGLQKLWSQLVQPGWTILEVGAGQGFHTLSLALLTGPAGRVLAWEPCAAWRAVLHDNVAAHELEKIVSIHMDQPMPHEQAPDLIVIPRKNPANVFLDRQWFLAALATQGLHIFRADERGELLPRDQVDWDSDFVVMREPTE